MRSVILLFARAPIAGRVKTRLLPALGAQGACDLHEWLVRDALERLSALGGVELWTDEPTSAWPEFRGPRHVQAAGDLGARMLAALNRSLPSLLVGSDAPAIPPEHLLALADSPADVTLGPTEDGGFYAIHARRTHPAMFEGVAWSSGKERAQTLAACRRAGLTTAEGAAWFDIDTPADLEKAEAGGLLPSPPWTRLRT